MDTFYDNLKAIDFGKIIEEKLIETIAGKSISSIANIFAKYSKSTLRKARQIFKSIEEYEGFAKEFDLEIKESVVLKRISHNLKMTSIWSKDIYFTTALNSKTLNNVFVELDLFLSPLKFRFDEAENVPKIKGGSLLNSFQRHKIIYGGAGAGKTTLIKKICMEYIDRPGEHMFTCPIVIRFREIDYVHHNYGKHFGIYTILIDLLGINVSFPVVHIESFYNEYYSLLKQTVVTFLDDSLILLIADGFDEIPDSGIKSRIEREFHELALSLDNARFILTSRNNDFILQLPNTDNYEICPLNDDQIRLIIKKWLVDKAQSEDLYNKIVNSPYYDTTMRPLTLSHLCAIYERRKTIPPKPRYIYDFILNLLLEAWDQQRSILRPSNYADFYIEKKKEFLAHLSFWFSYHLKKNVFTGEELRKCYNRIHKTHNLPPSQAKKVVLELETHTGLFIQVGQNSFEFSHKSLQEFLSARYIYSLPKIPDSGILMSLPNETAIAVSLSSSPNLYFENFIMDYNKYYDSFWNIFLNRLIEESPDFNENPSVIVFFLIAIDKTQNSFMIQAFRSLLTKTNLHISIKSFYQIYTPNQLNDSHVRYLHNEIHKPLNIRNGFPSILVADAQIASYLNDTYT